MMEGDNCIASANNSICNIMKYMGKFFRMLIFTWHFRFGFSEACKVFFVHIKNNPRLAINYAELYEVYASQKEN